jgi:hypothetical protein
MGIQLLVIPNDPFSGNTTTFAIMETGTVIIMILNQKKI